MPTPYTYRLTRMDFNDGTKIVPGNLTVIVGPNNAGKSRALKDIVVRTTQNSQIAGVVVTDVQWTFPNSLQDLRESYDVERYRAERGTWAFRTLQPDLCTAHSESGGGEWPNEYENTIANAGSNSRRSFVQMFGKALVAYLTTEHRLQLVSEADRSPGRSAAPRARFPASATKSVKATKTSVRAYVGSGRRN